jgi:hypothetical protein
MTMKRWEMVRDLLTRVGHEGEAARQPTRRAHIDLGFELAPQVQGSDSRKPQIPPVALSEVAVVSFLEGISPAALPLSVAEAARLETELASLRGLDPLEAFTLCHEWLVTQGSFRTSGGEHDRGCEFSSKEGAYAS